MYGGSALAVDPFAINGVESPDAVEGESASGTDTSLGDGDGVEGLDGMETNENKSGNGHRRWEECKQESDAWQANSDW